MKEPPPTINRKTDVSPTPVAAFNFDYKLIAIFGSIKEVSKITGVVRQSIIKAVYGDIISINKIYLRSIPDDIVLDLDDISKLTLFEFDRICGNKDRKIYNGRKKTKSNVIMESEHRKAKNNQ